MGQGSSTSSNESRSQFIDGSLNFRVFQMSDFHLISIWYTCQFECYNIECCVNKIVNCEYQ